MVLIGYLILALGKAKKLFIKYFPAVGLVFSIMYVWGVIGTIDRNRVVSITEIVIVAWIVTILGLVWVILSHKETPKKRNNMKH